MDYLDAILKVIGVAGTAYGNYTDAEVADSYATAQAARANIAAAEAAAARESVTLAGIQIEKQWLYVGAALVGVAIIAYALKK